MITGSLDGAQAERADVGRAGGRPGIAAGRGARRPDGGADEQCRREPQGAELDASVLHDGLAGLCSRQRYDGGHDGDVAG
jgi:hypothetical protein